MFRSLIILAAIVLLVMVVRNRLRQRGVSQAADKQVDSVRCAHCRHYLPKKDALHDGELFFCNPDHQQAWRDNADG